MKVTGTSHLAAGRDAVWNALNDPAMLVSAIPGCQRLESLGADAYAMTLAAGVGSIKGVYQGQVRLTDQVQPGSFRMNARGAGAAGTIGADVLVSLTDAASGGTDLVYDADATVGGMIGGVGQRMLAGVSKKMAAEFFANVDGLLAGVPAPGLAGAPAPGLPEGGGAGIQPRSSVARQPGPSTPTQPPSVRPTAGAAGTVYTAPRANPPTRRTGFAAGVAVGAAAALAGALVGGWLAGRRGGGSR